MTLRANIERVELLNVSQYRQGNFDGLCVYYVGAMMLSSLYPRYSETFGELARKKGTRNRAHDPLIRYYVGEYRNAPPGSDDRYVLARWFFEGETVESLCNTLNEIMKADNESTRFKCRNRKTTEGSFCRIIKSIDMGLPVVLGWSTEDYGNHAVLVTGYWHGRDNWLLLNDPGGESRMSWPVLADAVQDSLEILTCNPTTHAGPRPDKALTSVDGSVEIYRWTPCGAYVSLEQYFRRD